MKFSALILETYTAFNKVFNIRLYLSLAAVFTIMAWLISAPLLAQDARDASSVDESSKLGPDGGIEIENYLLDDFENSALWFGAMEIDDGVVHVRRVYGGAQELKDEDSENSQFALGAKVNFLRRSFSQASVEPPRAVTVPGLTQKLSVWVHSRGVAHTLYAVIRDFQGKVFKVRFGDLGFDGWQKMEAHIPDTVVQDSKVYENYYHRQGITFLSFLIEFAPLEAVGDYFVYFDNLAAETNVYLYKQAIENDALPNEERVDPIDNW